MFLNKTVMNHVRRTIALLHHGSGSNHGDSGTFEAVLQNIRKRRPDAEIIGLTMNPAGTLRRHGITAYPIRQRTWSFGDTRTAGTEASKGVAFYDSLRAAAHRFPLGFKLLKGIKALVVDLPGAFLKELLLLARSLGVMRSVDLLIVCGGGQFRESCGSPWQLLNAPWQFPFTIFKWTLLARLGGARVMVLNVGTGPLIRPSTKWFAKGALALSNYNSFRDEESQALIKNIGFKGRTHVFPDSAYGLEIRGADAKSVTAETRPIVGFAPMAYNDPRLSPSHHSAINNEFIQRLGKFGSSLIKQGYCLNLFCTDISMDPPAVEDMASILRRQHGFMAAGTPDAISRVHQWTTAELLENMSAMDYVVAVRFHAVVFAHMLNKPVLAISHHPKVKALMNDWGLSEYCVDIRACDPDVLEKRFASLVANRDQIKKRMAEKLVFNERKLEIQFDELFSHQTVPDVNVLDRPLGELGSALVSLAHLFGADVTVASQVIAQISGLRFVKYWEQRSRATFAAMVLLSVISVGLLDYITGVEASLSVIYLLAIGAAAWFVGRGFAILVSILSVAVSLCADLAGGAHFSRPLIPVWNAITLTLFYLVVVWLITTLHSLQRDVEARVRQHTATLKEATQGTKVESNSFVDHKATW